MRPAKWRRLLDDPNVRRWHENLARGSQLTATDRLRLLARYLEHHHLRPTELVDRALKDRRAVEDQLSDFIGKLEREKKAPGYISNYVKAIRSWLDFNEIRLERKFKVRDAEATPTIEDERVPNKEELRQILGRASLRGRVVVSFMAFAGLRPETLGNHDGSDGLRLADLPEIQVVEKTVAFTKLPIMVVVRRGLSKAGHRYFSFLASEGCDYLKAYLEARLASGERLGPQSPVIRPAPGFENTGWRAKVADRPFIVTKNVTADVRRAMRPGFDWRPYVLRSYFDSMLLLAESNGRMNRDFRASLMGHRGGIEGRYTLDKGRLAENLVEEMRRAFKNSEPFLTTSAPIEDMKSMLLKTFREQAKAYGIDPLKVKIEKEKAGTKLDPDEEIRLLTVEIAKRSAPHLMSPGTTFVNGQGRKNKILTGERQLLRHLDGGWELVSNLGDEKYLVRLAG